jgi:predicted Zn finger-like uncharacterized protein
MDVQCERCKTEYEFDDALVSGRGTTVRCTNCGHQFKVRSTEATDPGSDQWLVHTGAGHRLTFVSLRELQRAILAKQVSRTDVLVRGAGPPRSLGSIAELEPFFEGKAAPRPGASAASNAPPMQSSNMRSADPSAPMTFPKRSAHWSPEPAVLPYVARVPATGQVPSTRKTDSFGPPPDAQPSKTDTLRPPADGTAAPPPAPMQGPPQQVVGAAHHLAPPTPPVAIVPARNRSGETAPMMELYPASSPLPPPNHRRPPMRSEMRSEEDLPPMRAQAPSVGPDDYFVPRRRRVGGWVVAVVLLLAVGVGGWAVARPYLVARSAAGAAHLDPRAHQFVVDGERALSDGNLDVAQEAFDKASALAERDPHVLLDEARVSAARADIPWLKLRLLPAEATDEARAAKLQLDDFVARARRMADDAVAAAPEDPAAVRARIDALRLGGNQDAARASVSKILSLGSQAETAYILAALDLAEPDPLWTTVIERLRLAAAGESNAGRARAALVYALAKSGDVAGAKAELAKLDALVRPYPLVPNLHALVDKAVPRPVVDGGIALGVPRVDGSGLPPRTPPAVAAAVPAGGTGGAGVGGSGASTGTQATGGETTGGLQAAGQAIKHGDWDRARQIYEGLVARNPNDSEALAGIGDVDRAQGNTSGAIAAYKRALAVNPSYLPALLGAADTEWATGDRATAIRGYKDIADRFPEGTYPSYVKSRTEGSAPAGAGAAGGSGDRNGL